MKELLILGLLNSAPNGDININKNNRVETYQKYNDIVIDNEGGVYQKFGKDELLSPDGTYCYTIKETTICN